MIEVDHLTKYYGPIMAIQELSFSVEKGEILGFLGPNGAGKTTTMRILSGFMPATSGRAVVAVGHPPPGSKQLLDRIPANRYHHAR